MTDFHLLIRADGGLGVGIGHIMRCLALAEELSEFDLKITFAGKIDEAVRKIVLARGFDCLPLPGGLGLPGELDCLAPELASRGVHCVITDCYNLSEAYLTNLRKRVLLLVAIDDLNPYPFPAQMVINGNCYAPALSYTGSYGDTTFLLGLPYLLLQREFRKCQAKIINQEVSRILVTVGGCDVLNLTPGILTALDIWKSGLEIDVVIGPGFTDLAEIEATAARIQAQVNLHQNISKLSELMAKADLAVSAGGTTMYELAATGTPTITLLQAENQVLAAETMALAGVCYNLGLGDFPFQKDLLKILAMVADPIVRGRMSSKGLSLIDGKGSVRCAQEIVSRLQALRRKARTLE